ncbi:MAG TPA: response regulator transcription factor [Gemmatimonadaceae bacterium]|nr:response regulator transcription factor [Gemmatimonadaceae bacterium]
MRILVVEDDRQLRTSMARGLREASHVVEQASTGEQAIALARAGAFDVMILDVRLPDVDGLAVCRAIREAGNRLPVLMLTALDGVDQRIAGLDAGADDYLTKPFDFGELLARLRALSRRRLDALPEQLTVGDLTVDMARRAARRGDRDIELTAKEFALLVYLARNAGRVVNRAELLQHVWDDPRNSYSNIIDVYAGRLRRKIDEDETEPALFRTVRGAGFMLEAPTAPPAAPTARAARGRR